MKTKLTNFGEKLRASLWLIPGLMAMLSIAMALAMVSIDEVIQPRGLDPFPMIYKGGPDGARAVLSTIAGSMVSLTGITFSITVVALTLASTQFGPRLLRNFLRDRGNQIVLGTFIATFLYCLLVLRSVRGTDQHVFVPHLSVTAGILLVIASVGVLIYFIHHVAQSIQAAHVIALVGKDLDEILDRLYPETIGAESPGPDLTSKPDFADKTTPAKAMRSGYIQAIDSEGLMKLAVTHDVVIQVNCRPGHHVIAGSVLVNVCSAEGVDKELATGINEVFILGSERTGEQDAEFAVNQLVEVAVRALSPGINDPFTAINCIDRLGVSLAKLTKRSIPSPYRYDANNKLRVIADFNAFADLTNAAFNQIRQAGRNNAAVTIRLLEVIAEIAGHARRDGDRSALLHQAILIERSSHSSLPEEEDRKDVRRRFEAAERALNGAD